MSEHVSERGVVREPPERQRARQAGDSSPAAPAFAAPWLALQKTAGNAAVARGLSRDAPLIRRACACGGHAGGKPCAKCAHHEEEEERLRRSAAAGASALDRGAPISDELRGYLARSRGAGRPLDPAVRASLEPSFGSALADVRLHTGPAAAWAARSIQARAFALGKDIWFGESEYRPHDSAGRYLLAHEVAHTVEQRAPVSLDRVRLGGVNDAAEARADSAARATLRRQPIPTAGRTQDVIHRYAIQRVERVEEGGEPVVHVDLDNGIRYNVRRECAVVREDETSTSFRPPRVDADADSHDVWVQISWCQGTRGSVTAGADVPDALQDAVRRLVSGALAGRSPDDVLSETTLTPFIDFAVARSGGISVDGRVQVTVGGEGVQSGSGSINFHYGPVDVGVTGSGSEGGGAQVGLTLTFTPGRGSDTFDCPTTSRRRERLRQQCTLVCTHGPLDPPPVEPRTPETRTDRETSTIYFEYATTALNPRLNDLEGLRALLSQGYRVESIRGFASPEGPLDRRPRGRFQGNRALSTERADRARAEIAALCGSEQSCMLSEEAPVAGCGERFGGAAECEPLGEGEVRTERVGRAVAREAVREFMDDPSEMARLTPEDSQALGRATGDDDRARIIYPYLRRATVSLVRTVELPLPPLDPAHLRIPADYFYCPDDVLERARPLLEPSRTGPVR